MLLICMKLALLSIIFSRPVKLSFKHKFMCQLKLIINCLNFNRICVFSQSNLLQPACRRPIFSSLKGKRDALRNAVVYRVSVSFFSSMLD